MSAQPLPASSQIILEVISGAQKGSLFQILSRRTTIGRADENDITLNDPKCSRIHAVIDVFEEAIIIKDASQKNSFYINGQKARQAKLRNGDVIRIGDTDIKFRNISTAIVNQGVSVPVKARPLAPVEPHKPTPSPSQQAGGLPPVRRRRQKSGLNFYMISGIVLFLFYVMFTYQKSSSNDPWKIRTNSDIEAEIQKSRQNLEVREALIAQKGRNSRQFLDAQSAFIRGFRDYQNGQYLLARRAFEQALSIYPQHELAERYRVLADQKMKEYVQNHMMEGKKYLERHNYSLCSAAYKKVMDAISDPQNKTHQEAEQRWKECNALQMGRY